MQAQPYAETFAVRAYEVDPAGRVTVQNLCNYMQEVAAVHAAQLGLPFERMRREQLAWVLARLQITLEKQLPAAGEHVTVETWPSRIEGLQFRRDFIASRADGTVAARGISHWVVVNYVTRRLVRIPEFIAKDKLMCDREAMPDSALRFPQPATEEPACCFQALRADIDRNLHVNNVRYLDWVLESAPDSVQNASFLRHLEILFKAEAFRGDAILAFTAPMPGDNDGSVHLVHSLVRTHDNKELVRARSSWESNA